MNIFFWRVGYVIILIFGFTSLLSQENIALITSSNQKIDSLLVLLEEVEVKSEISTQEAANTFLHASNYYLPVKAATKWAGGRNDITRMISNFAGSQVNSDENNAISVRGNAPSGILWRMNGMPISNPNHFSTLGNNGGPVMALNPNVLTGIDFLTGAFPAEYGNATSGVFDLIMRKGSTSEHKQMLQLSAFSGMEALAEGPIKRGQASYLVSARRSFLELARSAGIITDIVPDYSDINFNFNFRQNKHNFSLFGFAGNSKLNYSSSDEGTDTFKSNLLNLGFQHLYTANKRFFIKTTLGMSRGGNTFQNIDRVPSENFYYNFYQKTNETLYSLNSFLHYHLADSHKLRLGLLTQVNKVDLSSFFTTDNTENNFLETNYLGNHMSHQLHLSYLYNWKGGWKLQAGLHFSHTHLNNESLLEPRLYLGKEITKNQTVSISYGHHNQMQPSSVLFFNNRKIAGDSIFTNQSLKNTKSHHIVMGYKMDMPQKDFELSINAYYQNLYDIPVDSTAGSYSLVNYGMDIERDQRPSLINEGAAENLGIEFTISKKINDWRGMAAITLLDATYKGSNGKTLNSAYNLGHIVNILAGRKVRLSSKLDLMIDARINWAGGQYYTPVDEMSSNTQERTVRDYTLENKFRRPDFFRADLRFGMDLPSKRNIAQQVYLEFQNITNRTNPIREFYSEEEERIEMINNLGFFFDFTYRISF